MLTKANGAASFIKGGANGILCAMVINLWVILSWYISYPAFIFYTMGVPLAISTYLLLKQRSFKYFLIAWGASMITYTAVEWLLLRLDVTNYFFHLAAGDSVPMTAGDGLGVVTIFLFRTYLFQFIWMIIGFFAALIHTLIVRMKKQPANKPEQSM